MGGYITVFVVPFSMPRGKKLKVVFKQDFQQQGMLIPLDLNELIAVDHPVRTVNAVLDRVDNTSIIKQYRPGGTSSYHPRMLLKVIVHAYISNIYSSRKIEEAIKSSIHFMWLAGMRQPDHNTINRFRGVRLQQTLKPIFNQVVLMLCEEGLLNLRDQYVDGTKIEANANRYTFVWGRSIKTNRNRIGRQLDELWSYAQGVAAEELRDTDPPGTGSKKISRETVERINESLKNKEIDPKIKQKLNYAGKNWPAALDKYEQQEKVIGEGRNSYSKTDPDATFMHMKDDHMRNGQLKPAYNVQISTNNQFIAAYSLHQRPTDTTTLKPHLGGQVKGLGVKPSSVTADAGYGSEENYEWLEKSASPHTSSTISSIETNTIKVRVTKPYATDKLEYDAKNDRYRYPSDKMMKNIGPRERITATGFRQTITRYHTARCSGCPLQ